MPLFEFACPDCGKDFEELVGSSDGVERIRCPDCDSRKVVRKFSTFSARSAVKQKSSPLPMGGCGRCGDPSGPCGM